jgi:mRNA interferase YafQ
MYTPVTSSKFKKDLKRSKKRNKDLLKIKYIMQKLTDGETLTAINKDHPLTGNYSGRRECHIEPDWLLIYKIDLSVMEIIFERTGTHSDLFI